MTYYIIGAICAAAGLLMSYSGMFSDDDDDVQEPYDDNPIVDFIVRGCMMGMVFMGWPFALTLLATIFITEALGEY